MKRPSTAQSAGCDLLINRSDHVSTRFISTITLLWDLGSPHRPVHRRQPEVCRALAVGMSGGQINPNLLRINERALEFVRDMLNAKKLIAAICHAPWLLIEAGVVIDRPAISYHSNKTDMKNAGAHYRREATWRQGAEKGLVRPVSG